MTDDAYWRPIVLRELKAGEPVRRIGAIERIRSGSVIVDGTIEAALLDAIEDEGSYVHRERDWDEHGEVEWVSRTRRVADEALRLLGEPKRRARSIELIRARLSMRDPSAQTRLLAALERLGASP